MYTPKIRPDLIPHLYHIAKARGVPMTHMVNQFVEEALDFIEDTLEELEKRETQRSKER